MKILITGASSYLGARLYFDLKDKYDVLGTYSRTKLSENFVHLDITNETEVENVITDFMPDVIIHVASNASSKWCEKNPDKAILLNQTATKYILDATNSINGKLIYISSLAAVNPTNLYGETKLASENISKNAENGFLILRPSLILGYSPNTVNNRPFNRILKNIDEGNPAIYENAWNFQPTYIKHISEVIDACIEKNIWNKTIPIIVPEMTTRYGSAKDILKPFGIEVKIDESSKPYFKDFEIKTDVLEELGLPIYSYSKMIESIISEIKKRDKFKI